MALWLSVSEKGMRVVGPPLENIGMMVDGFFGPKKVEFSKGILCPNKNESGKS